MLISKSYSVFGKPCIYCVLNFKIKQCLPFIHFVEQDINCQANNYAYAFYILGVDTGVGGNVLLQIKQSFQQI